MREADVGPRRAVGLRGSRHRSLALAGSTTEYTGLALAGSTTEDTALALAGSTTEYTALALAGSTTEYAGLAVVGSTDDSGEARWVPTPRPDSASTTEGYLVKAVTWHGRKDMRVEEVPDPTIEEPTDAIIRITTTGLCGSDLHLYDPLTPFMTPGDVVGHEPMGVVEAVGSGVSDLKVGQRVVIPFNVSCGSCWMCDQHLYSQCETTQNHEHGTGASFYGYSKLYGQVPGGQAELLRVPYAEFAAQRVPDGPPDERFIYLSDVLPTAWQGVEYAAVPEGGTLLVMGAGPIGDMSARIAIHRGYRVIVVDRVPERLHRVSARGAETIDLNAVDDVPARVRELTGGRGADSVIDAVGMEAHGSPMAEALQKSLRLLPKKVQGTVMTQAGVDRLDALYTAIESVRRGGTLSILGVYGGAADPMPMMQLFDKQLQIRMGQANVRAWTDDLMAVLDQDDDVLGVEGFHTHALPLDEAPEAYAKFQAKDDGMVKVLFKP